MSMGGNPTIYAEGASGSPSQGGDKGLGSLLLAVTILARAAAVEQSAFDLPQLFDQLRVVRANRLGQIGQDC